MQTHWWSTFVLSLVFHLMLDLLDSSSDLSTSRNRTIYILQLAQHLIPRSIIYAIDHWTHSSMCISTEFNILRQWSTEWSVMDSFLSVVSLCRVIWSAEFPSRISINPLSVARSSSVILSRVRPHAFKCCDLFHQLFRLPPRQTIPCRWVTVLTWARITVQCCLDYLWHLSSYHSNVTSIKCRFSGIVFLHPLQKCSCFQLTPWHSLPEHSGWEICSHDMSELCLTEMCCVSLPFCRDCWHGIL